MYANLSLLIGLMLVVTAVEIRPFGNWGTYLLAVFITTTAVTMAFLFAGYRLF